VVAESAIRSVRPEDTVLIGSLVCLQAGVDTRMNPIEMLDSCYKYGHGGWEGVSAHFYSASDLRRIRLKHMLSRYGRSCEATVTTEGCG